MAGIQQGGVTNRQLIAYSTAAFGTAFLAQPLQAYLPQLYAKEYGISLASLGLALFATRMFDAFSDQILGYLSDRTRTRLGARKPWMIAGVLIALAAGFFLVYPPAGVTVGFFLFWRIVYDFGWTMHGISYTAWGAELAPGYHERAKVTGYRGVFSGVGNIANDALPIGIALIGLTATAAYSMDLMQYIFLIALVAVPLLNGVAIFGAPTERAVQVLERPSPMKLLQSLKGNKPFWLYISAFALTGLGLGALSLQLTFYDGYLGVGDWFPYLMLTFGVSSILGIAPWVWVSKKIGKHKAYGLGMLMVSVASQFYWFIDPDTMSLQVILSIAFVICVFNGIGVACNVVVPPAILADVIDYGTLKSRVTQTGSYFGLQLLVTKVAGAFGAGIAFLIIAAFGFEAAAGAVNDDLGKFGLILTFVGLPATVKVIGGFMMWRFPIDERRHDIIRRRLAQRAEREGRDALAKSHPVEEADVTDRALGLDAG